MVFIIHRSLQPNFHTMEIDDEPESNALPIMKVSDIRKLDESYAQVYR